MGLDGEDLDRLTGVEDPGRHAALGGCGGEALGRVRDGLVDAVDLVALRMDRDRLAGAEDLDGDRGLGRVERDGQWAGWAAVREADHRAIHGDEDHVERSMPAGHAPPVPVEHRVAEMQDAHPLGFDEPRHLRVADAVARGKRGQSERADRRRLPWRDPPAVQARGHELAFGLGERELLEDVAASRERLEHGRSGRERRREGARIGVIAMEVRDEPGEGPGFGPDDVRRGDSATCAPSGAKTAPASSSGSITTLAPPASSSTPAQPSHFTRIVPSFSLALEVIQHDRSFSMLSDVPRRSVAAVAESRASAVEAAVDLASVEGLEGITIGRLAGELEMSKSGLIGRFGDKEALQRAVLEAAAERFTDAVWGRADPSEPGLPRLEAIVDAWIDHLRDGVFPGGCFVTTASVEYDARPGPLHDDAAALVRRWLGVLEAEARRAREVGDLPAARDPADVAFELHSLASGGSVAGRLIGDAAALARTRAAMRRAIGLSDTENPLG